MGERNCTSLIFLINDITLNNIEQGNKEGKEDNDDERIDKNSIRSVLFISDTDMETTFRKIDSLNLQDKVSVLEFDNSIIINLAGGSSIVLVRINRDDDDNKVNA